MAIEDDQNVNMTSDNFTCSTFSFNLERLPALASLMPDNKISPSISNPPTRRSYFIYVNRPLYLHDNMPEV
jgi:hypothetical protein